MVFKYLGLCSREVLRPVVNSITIVNFTVQWRRDTVTAVAVIGEETVLGKLNAVFFSTVKFEFNALLCTGGAGAVIIINDIDMSAVSYSITFFICR